MADDTKMMIPKRPSMLGYNPSPLVGTHLPKEDETLDLMSQVRALHSRDTAKRSTRWGFIVLPN